MLGRTRAIFEVSMVSRTHSEDSDPVLEVSAIGTADSNGDYIQHEAVLPHKAHSATADAMTVVIQPESQPPTENTAGVALHDAVSNSDEITSVTKSRLRKSGSGLFRALVFLEGHRLTALTFAVGVVLLLLSAVLAGR